jgi:hypothetical protein
MPEPDLIQLFANPLHLAEIRQLFGFAPIFDSKYS